MCSNSVTVCAGVTSVPTTATSIPNALLCLAALYTICQGLGPQVFELCSIVPGLRMAPPSCSPVLTLIKIAKQQHNEEGHCLAGAPPCASHTACVYGSVEALSLSAAVGPDVAKNGSASVDQSAVPPEEGLHPDVSTLGNHKQMQWVCLGYPRRPGQQSCVSGNGQGMQMCSLCWQLTVHLQCSGGLGSIYGG